MIKLKDLVDILPSNSYVQIALPVHDADALSGVQYTEPEFADYVLRKYPNCADLEVWSMYYESNAIGCSCYVIEVDN